jgi:hypothetical protein
VEELRSDGDFTLRSTGLREAGLAEVEIASCPQRLAQVATAIVTGVARVGIETPDAIADGKTIGGHFVRADQPLIESLRLIRVDDDSSVLRIVDREESDAGFPHRLVATHLCASAGASPSEALRLLLVAIEVWPKETTASNCALADYELNPNNFWSWIDLGTALSSVGQVGDAIAHWKTAICMWPRGGKLYASRVLARGEPRLTQGNSARVVHEFWRSVSTDAIRGWCEELAITLPTDALSE